MPRSRSRRLSSGVLGFARHHGCACSSADLWVLELGGTLEAAVGRLSAKRRPQPLRTGAPGPGGRWPLAAPRGWEPRAAAGSGERNRQDLRLRALRRATQHVNVVYTEWHGTWSSTAGARHGAPASPHPRPMVAPRARDQHEDAERRTLAPTQKSSATPGSGGSGGHSGLARGPGGGREAWEALPP